MIPRRRLTHPVAYNTSNRVFFILAFILSTTHSYYHMAITLKENIPLAPLTTIRLGGNATHYVSCTTDEDIIAALSYAKEQGMRVHVLGGGSNTIFADEGFNGLIIHIQTKGITSVDDGEKTIVTAQAGEAWDDVVLFAIEKNLTGLECLSGIPGSCGGTPYQNVGAYGQEVAHTLTSVTVIDRETLERSTITNSDCAFGYRTSRFKAQDKDRFIITSVSFGLSKGGAPIIAYPELAKILQDIAPGKEGLLNVRNAVLSLRKKKSMVIDTHDPNSVSCGSFFTNPIVSAPTLAAIQEKTVDQIPFYPVEQPSNDGIAYMKLSAAWLVEHAGFPKGTRRGNVGTSEHHSLALVNHGGTTQELLALSAEIIAAVEQTFGITLALEPLVV